MKIPDSQFTMKEANLATTLGVARAEVAKQRKAMEKDVDWRIGVKGRAGVWLTANAAASITLAFGVLAAAPATPAAPIQPQGNIEQIAVMKTNWINQQLMRGQRSNGEVVRIRIRKNTRKNMSEGLLLPCQHVEADLWQCVRHPRYRGKM